MRKKRLDELVMDNLKVDSKEAVSLILQGMVFVDGIVYTKPGVKFLQDSSLHLKKSSNFVSRGGEKLQHALQLFFLNIENYICIDIGASTGGFTDCLLSKGSKLVYAVDCGKNLLHSNLKKDPRVISFEGTNARYLNTTNLPNTVDLITIDVSFISIKKILPGVLQYFKPGYQIICLFKPHFEAPIQCIKKGGILPLEQHIFVLTNFLQFLKLMKICVSNFCRSALLGEKSKNQEYFFLLDTRKNFDKSKIAIREDLQKILLDVP